MTLPDTTEQKKVEFYAAAVNAWMTTGLERDRSLLALSAGGIAVLVTPNLLGDDRNERAQQLLMTKTEEWAYEREWRMLEPDRGPEARAFPPELLSAIILGAKITKTYKDMVVGWVTQRSMPLPVYQAILDVPNNSLAFELLG